MISYPYIEDLFKRVLSKSNAIQGRFYISYNSVHNINFDNFSQLIQDSVLSVNQKKYPVAIMPAPVVHPDYNEGEYDEYNFSIFFLKQTYNSRDGINKNTVTSTHTVMMDWHDMQRCAINFIKVLDTITTNTIECPFRVKGMGKCTPVSMIGIDQLSGVRIDFTGLLFSGCEIEDYKLEDMDDFELPFGDSHPEHKI